MSKIGSLSKLHTTLGQRIKLLTPYWIQRAAMSLEENLLPNDKLVAATLSTPCRQSIELTAMSANGAIAVAGGMNKHDQVLTLFAPGSREPKVIARGDKFVRLFFPEGSDEPAFEALCKGNDHKTRHYVGWGSHLLTLDTVFAQKESITDIRFWTTESDTYCLVAYYRPYHLWQKVVVYLCQENGQFEIVRTYEDKVLLYASCLGIYAGQELIKFNKHKGDTFACCLHYGDWESGGWDDYLDENLITIGKDGHPQFAARRRGQGAHMLICPPDFEARLSGANALETVAAGEGGLIYTRDPEKPEVINCNSGCQFVWPPSYNKIVGERQVFLFQDHLVIIAPSGEKDQTAGDVTVDQWIHVTYKLDGQMTGVHIIDERTEKLYSLRQVGQMLVYRDHKNHLHLIAHPEILLESELVVKPNFIIPISSLVACNDGSIRAIKPLTEGSIAEIVVYRP